MTKACPWRIVLASVAVGVAVVAGAAWPAAAEAPAKAAACLHYLGHAAFVLSLDDGTTVLMDYGQSRAYGLDSPVHPLGGLVPDIATYSHDHPDHAGGPLPEGVGRVLRGPQGLTLGGLGIRTIPTFERSLETPDTNGFLFTYKGLRILHLGDCQALIQGVGQEEVRQRIRALYPDLYDVVLVPIGFVRDILEPAAAFVGLLRARIVVPMHYWSPGDRDAFLRLVDGRPGTDGKALRTRLVRGPALCLEPGAASGPEVVALDPAPFETKGVWSVPEGAPVLPNGRFDADEWADAAEVVAAGGTAVLVKHDARFVFVGVRFGATGHTGLDLYLAPEGAPARRLHVSAALGDATWSEPGWGELRWGENTDWTANSVGLITVDGRQQTVPSEGFEVVIARSAMPEGSFSLMVHLKRPDLVLPATADPERPATWLRARV